LSARTKKTSHKIKEEEGPPAPGSLRPSAKIAFKDGVTSQEGKKKNKIEDLALKRIGWKKEKDGGGRKEKPHEILSTSCREVPTGKARRRAKNCSLGSVLER